MARQQTQLQNLLDQVNTLLNSNMKLDYAPQYGGYMLSAVPREFYFLQFSARLAYKEMLSFLYGIICGIRIEQEQIFTSAPK